MHLRHRHRDLAIGGGQHDAVTLGGVVGAQGVGLQAQGADLVVGAAVRLGITAIDVVQAGNAHIRKPVVFRAGDGAVAIAIHPHPQLAVDRVIRINGGITIAVPRGQTGQAPHLLRHPPIAEHFLSVVNRAVDVFVQHQKAVDVVQPGGLVFELQVAVTVEFGLQIGRAIHVELHLAASQRCRGQLAPQVNAHWIPAQGGRPGCHGRCQ